MNQEKEETVIVVVEEEVRLILYEHI